MSCKSWHDSLTERLYDESGAEGNAAFTAHLDSCAACRATLDDFQRVRTRLREDEMDLPRAPRVVVLRTRSMFRPALLAASILGAAVLAGAGAGAGYALGVGRAPASPVAAAVPPDAAGVSTEALVRQQVDSRMAELRESLAPANGGSQGGSAPKESGERAVTAADLRAEFAKFERRLNGTRSADLDYVLDQIAASEFRVGTRLGKTNQALRSVALATTPYVNEQ